MEKFNLFGGQIGNLLKRKNWIFYFFCQWADWTGRRSGESSIDGLKVWAKYFKIVGPILILGYFIFCQEMPKRNPSSPVNYSISIPYKILTLFRF